MTDAWSSFFVFFYIYIQDVECQKWNNENKSYDRTVKRLNKPNCHECLFVFLFAKSAF